MRKKSSQPISRQQYQPYPYALQNVELVVDLDARQTRVRSTLRFERIGSGPVPLVLNGTDIELHSIALNNRQLGTEEYTLTDDTLSLMPTGSEFMLSIDTLCTPADNTTLMGLYQSGSHLFTQCEAEGFRRITWFPDRPDVMAVYTVTMRASQAHYPVLLSNGNLVSRRKLDEDRHEAVWHDPHPKPSYLFAMVAGDFVVREKTVRTRSARPVTLQIYSDPDAHDQTGWAMACLENAMRWDEDRFDLELDLDRFMIVAARDFNMGAMENKGLNIFNASYVLASPDTATDRMYRVIEAVIGHEYFHNWTGNRITCRDWFQLSLKEGLTVFREQEFSADMLAQGLDGTAAASARAVKRIDDVNILRNQQYPEDAGPMAHPVRPESYVEISNFYTATIYEKGAELVRMLHTLLGEAGFQQGMQEYIRRHDGQAVTCDDFLDAMEIVYADQHPGRNLDGFRRWYSQAGTPNVTIESTFEASTGTLALAIRQDNPPAGLEVQQQPPVSKPPLHIPIALGMLDSKGQPLSLDDASGPDKTALLELQETTQHWQMTGLPEAPVLSVLRGFSAPVTIHMERHAGELEMLAMHDPDPFARWEAIQQLGAQTLWARIDQPDSSEAANLTQSLARTWTGILTDTHLAPDYQARALTLISGSQLMHQRRPLDPHSGHQARRMLQCELGGQLGDLWLETWQRYGTLTQKPYRPHPADAGQRALRAVALAALVAGGHPQAMDKVWQQYDEANNLTDRLSALTAATQHGREQDSLDLLERFYHDAADESVVDEWFGLQARAAWTDVDRARTLMAHPAFSLRNPNRARAVIYQFCLQNPLASHTPQGYAFWEEQILALDALNPELGARLARGLENWNDTIEPFRSQMLATLETLSRCNQLSTNAREIIMRALDEKKTGEIS